MLRTSDISFQTLSFVFHFKVERDRILLGGNFNKLYTDDMI